VYPPDPVPTADPDRFLEVRILVSFRGERLADAGDDGVLVGKKDPAFFGDFFVADPDSEFAAATFDKLCVDPE
jgi:hypothetical protein